MAANEEKNLLRKIDYKYINPKLIYAYRLPDNLSEDNPDDILWLCTDISGTPTMYGSNDFSQWTSLVQLRGYIPESYEGDYHELDLTIIKYMRENGYMLSYAEGVRSIPDSPRKTITYHFREIVGV